MKRTAAKLTLAAAILALLWLAVFVVNQTAQIVELAARIHPVFGTVVLWGLLAAYLGLGVVLYVQFARLPRSLTPPRSEDDPSFDAYLAEVRKRLARNPRLRGMTFSNREDVERGLEILGKEADRIIRDAAAAVFLTTAVSQNGKLDVLLVLSAQTRMVWRIVRVYRQRPGPRDLLRLYGNVAATAFVASELEDVDISRQIEPVLTSSLGALAGGLPGTQVIGHVLVNAVLTGSTNAFLTLRVGIVAKRYSGSLVVEERTALRRSATLEAGRLLGRIVAQGTAKLTGAVWKASKGKIGGALSGMGGYARDAGASVLSFVGLRREKPQEEPDPDASLEEPGPIGD